MSAKMTLIEGSPSHTTKVVYSYRGWRVIGYRSGSPNAGFRMRRWSWTIEKGGAVIPAISRAHARKQINNIHFSDDHPASENDKRYAEALRSAKDQERRFAEEDAQVAADWELVNPVSAALIKIKALVENPHWNAERKYRIAALADEALAAIAKGGGK